MRMYSIAPMAAAATLLLAFGAGLKPEDTPRAAALPAVTVIADDETRQVQTSAATVAELLQEVEVILGPLDRTSPSPETAIADDLTVRVTRVRRRHITEEVTVPGRTVVLAVPDRQAGFTEVLQEGSDGRVRRVVRVWEKDGEDTHRQVIEERTLRAPEDTVVMRGTLGLATRGGNWRRPLRMEVTAYDPGPRSCGKYASGYTATGAKAEKGVVAVDERVIPMGTRLYIPGYGFGVAADRGSAIKGMRIDVCFPTYKEAMDWGRRRTDVYVLD